jgi:hypothetical protein
LKRCLGFLLALTTYSVALQPQYAQKGTIIRMRMAECLEQPHRFMMAMSGAAGQAPDELCPEYVLLSDKVVYVIVGKTSGSLIPLAETTQFRLQKNTLLIRADDESRETKFMLREMVLRSEWDHIHPNLLIDEEEPQRRRLENPAGAQPISAQSR